MVSRGYTGTGQGQTLLQARQGNLEAIARLLNQSLNPRGIEARVYPESDGIQVLLESTAVPPQGEMVDFIQKGISQLGVPDLRRVRVVGNQLGHSEYDWQEAIALNPMPPSFAFSQQAESLPITDFEVGHGAIGQQIVYGEQLLQMTSHGAVLMPHGSSHAALVRTRPVPDIAQFCADADAYGREEEVQGAIAALKESQPLEFYAPSGMGKTTVLRAIAHHHDLESDCPDGGVYYSVQDQSLEDLLYTLFQTFFEYDEEIPRKPTPEQIYQSFRGRRSLLVLDEVQLDGMRVSSLVNHLPTVHLLLGSSTYHAMPDGSSLPLGGLSDAAAIGRIEAQIHRSLEEHERPAAISLNHHLQGNPLRLRQATNLVYYRYLDLPTLAQHLGSASLENWLLRAAAKLPENARRVLAALGVIGDVPVRTHHIGSLIGVGNPQTVLEDLERQGWLTTDGYRYSLAPNLLEPLRQQWNLSPWRQPVINHFLQWTQKHASVTGALPQEGNLLVWMMVQAAEHHHWSEILQMARAMDAPFMVGGQWDRWEQIWQLALRAGEALGDQEAIAHAYHQLGTRALCLGDELSAHTQLTQAMQIRQAMNHETAAAASYHNLRYLLEPEATYETAAYQQAGSFQATTQAESAYREEPMAAPTEAKRGIPPVVQVGMVAATFLGLGSWLAWQMYRTPPDFAITPVQISFGDQALNRTTEPQALTIQNTTDGLLELQPVSFSGTNPTDFQVVSDACSRIPLPPDQACQIQVTFTPQLEGERTADLVVGDRDQREQRVSLSGTGQTSQTDVEAPITLSFQPGNLDFGDYAVNEAQPNEPRRIVLQNESQQPVTVQAISPVGEASNNFPTTHDCTGAPLAPGQSCSIYVTFQPSVEGQRTANLAVTDNTGNLWNVPLRGNGVRVTPQAPALSLRPGAINFGEQQLNTNSREYTITAINNGNQPLNISEVLVEGSESFRIRRNTCQRGSLQPGDECTLGVSFTPQAQGGQSGEVVIVSNDPRGDGQVYVGGVGTVPQTPGIRVEPTVLNFSDVPVESASAPQQIAIRNTGNTQLSVGQITISGNGDFVSEDNGAIGRACSNVALRPGEDCRFGVVFLPFVEGDRIAQITIPSDAPQGNSVIELQGRGIVQRFPALSVNPGSLNFSPVPQGATSAPQNLALINSGNAPLEIGNISINGAHPNDFIPSTNDGFSQLACANIVLRPGESCGLQITFGPLATGDRSAQLIIPSNNDPNGPLSVNLTGFGESDAPI
ncbi:choice-of-anchor D domain-containing protein [Vacuolonema iberomarrocanum]|uniref:choice-of-anchor D domain-containing protein n=1 Tax=Vacuolonema iberomarrocanum TaxID=3454632 RepID=UPI0019EC4BE9|nr:choice-of-anchor D domain-containing protein [filamentous cyanobacterium LEGE 07170]